MLISLIVSALMGVSLTISCANKAAMQVGDKTSQRVESKPRETPVPFQPTKQNKGNRCAPRYYLGAGRDEDNDPICYELQKRLIDATREGELEAMREALKDGANPEGSIDDSYPPLQTAAVSGRSDAVRLLLDNGAQVNRVTNFQITPLLSAAFHGYTDVVKLLLERGADACYKTSVGTAGAVAQSKGHKEIAELLKAAEATKCK